MAQAGRFNEIAAYCLGDVIVSFRLMLRFALVRGELDQGQLAASETSLDQAIQRQLERWPPLMAMR